MGEIPTLQFGMHLHALLMELFHGQLPKNGGKRLRKHFVGQYTLWASNGKWPDSSPLDDRGR